MRNSPYRANQMGLTFSRVGPETSGVDGLGTRWVVTLIILLTISSPRAFGFNVPH